jgi:hypothetical protein
MLDGVAVAEGGLETVKDARCMVFLNSLATVLE